MKITRLSAWIDLPYVTSGTQIYRPDFESLTDDQLIIEADLRSYSTFGYDEFYFVPNLNTVFAYRSLSSFKS